jgi:hypothetical protein
MTEERSITMADIPIHNDTGYALTDAMTQDILRDAQEHFGDVIRAIRVQSGLQRHALNARTREVRYAFSPQDFGVIPALPLASERPRPSRRDAGPAAESLPASGEEEDLELRETSRESLDAGQEADEEDDIFRLDAPVEDIDEDEEADLLDQEDEEDE